ncbi:hypothetical protein JAAARDRAFT_208592 [Jaapia argillacea MUCL 33604]|uniref:Rpr2-domain-containing protein n=1 Tax=Jaapia argillacea MUCL 33604 TaxID=933084 RepID=A0A067PPT7_9AGAM|nr:hypothetical protein JAAARDRAFT_208592 [Jaapia argillacea MUCL 33604]
MAKKSKDEVPNPNSVANRDILQRLNFLYQAGVYLNSIPEQLRSSSDTTGSASTTPNHQVVPNESKRRPRKKRCRASRSLTTSDLARSYVKTMKSVSQRAIVKIDPTVKRTLCTGCDAVLLPGSTATVRVKASSCHGNTITYTCLACGNSRRIPAPPIFKVGDEVHPASPSTLAPINAPVSANNAPIPQPQPVELRPGSLFEGIVTNQNPMTSNSPSVCQPSKSARKRRKANMARLPPFFEREVGHVVFRGNEKVQQANL